MIEHKNAKDMKRKTILTIALFLMSLATYATGQDGDVIYINFRAAVGTRPFFQCIGGDRGR